MVRLMVMLVVVAGILGGQGLPTPSCATSAPAGAKYEVIQSPLTARWTYLLDRTTGQVWQLTSNGRSLAWTAMPMQPAPVRGTRPRFQIFTSGLSAKDTYMLDTDTGFTWVAVKDGWVPLGSAKAD